MKMTFELPDSLVREIKLRGVLRGQKLKEVVADLLKRGLEREDANSLPRPTLTLHPKTGLPRIECPHEACTEEEMTPDRVANLLLEQEVAWHHEAGR